MSAKCFDSAQQILVVKGVEGIEKSDFKIAIQIQQNKKRGKIIKERNKETKIIIMANFMITKKRR